ncbi:MAG: hypothetical protein ACRDVL_06385 [Acidimicrobiia bacterium]
MSTYDARQMSGTDVGENQVVQQRGRVVQLIGYDERWPDHLRRSADGSRGVREGNISGASPCKVSRQKLASDISVDLREWLASDRFLRPSKSRVNGGLYDARP